MLRGLVHQIDSDFEVIVADDGSRKEQQHILFDSDIARTLAITHVWHPDVGFTASRIRNRGVAACSGDYLIFLDGDCVPEVDFVARHKALAQSGCFINGSRILLSEGFTQRVLNQEESISGRSVAYWLRQYQKGHANKLAGWLRLPDNPFHFLRIQREFSWKRIRSCNLSVWRSDFERVDGFDESFVGWGHEDADFVLRLHHAGLVRKNGFCATEVFHLWHKEAARNQESLNAKWVRERTLTDVILPTLGYAQKRYNDDAVVTKLE
ncbi:MAG: hypothetical protein RIR79_1182 [Pseudomonadota bacterium]